MTASSLNLQYLLLLLLMFSFGCATKSSREKILRDMAIGTAVGVLMAQTKNSNRQAYSTLYGSLGAASAGAISSYYHLKDEEIMRNENQKLKVELAQFEKQLKPQLIQQGSNLFASPLPKEVSGLIEPGEWKRYKMDQWVQDQNQPNTWYRQVEIFEITPPISR